jgi:hypothetical protein
MNPQNGKVFWKIWGETEYETIDFNALSPERAFHLYQGWTRNPKNSVLLLECVNGANCYQKGLASNDPDAWPALRLELSEVKELLLGR